MPLISPWSYDPSSPSGLVRLYVPGENVQLSAVFNDNEIAAILNVQNGDPRLAAADLLDILASSTAKLQQKVSQMGLSQDGPAVGTSFRAQAKALRERVDNAPYFDWAEQVNDAFSERERYLKQFLRGQFT